MQLIFAEPEPPEDIIWPHDGQEFEFYIAVINTSDNIERHGIDIPCEVDAVLSECGTYHLENYLFRGQLPAESGVYSTRVRFYFIQGSWGQWDTDFGFDILEMTKL